MANLNLRKNLAQALSFTQMDDNFEYLESINESLESSLETRVSSEEASRASGDGSLTTRLDNLANDFATDVELSEAVSVEKLRAETAEGVIEGNLSTELLDRAAADTTLQGNIDDVAGDLSTEISDREADVSAEESRAIAAEGVLQGNIDGVSGDLVTEISDREADVSAEESRAIAAEGSLSTRAGDIEGDVTDLSTEVVNEVSSIDTVLAALDATYVDDAELSAAVSIEKLRAETAEGVIEGNLSTELLDRASADTSLSTRATGIEGNLSTELVDRAAADTSLSTRATGIEGDVTALSTEVVNEVSSIDTVLADLDATYVDDAELSTAVSVEKLRAETAEGVIEGNLSTELLDRAAADTTLQGNIDGVAGDLSDYETANDAALSTELVVRASADVVLQGNIDDVSGDLATEISDREADVSAEESRAIAAEGVIEGNLSTELVDRAAADTSLSTRAGDIEGDVSALSTEVVNEVSSIDTVLAALDATYVDDAELSAAVSVEKLRAETAEGVIEGNLSNELLARAAADTSLSTRAGDIEGDVTSLEGDVTSIDTRATGIEGDVTSIDTRATGIEGDVTSLEGDVTSIDTRATGIEGDVTSLEGDVTSIDTRATGIEGDLSTELVDRASADTSLSTRAGDIEGDVTALSTEVVNEVSSIDTVLADLDATYVDDAELSTAVSVEKLRAETAEGVIEGNLSTELVDRASADTSLSTRAGDIEGDVTALEADLSTELVDRAAADTSLETLTNNPTMILDGGKYDVILASDSFVNAPAIIVVNAPAESSVTIDMASAVRGSISTFIVADLAGDNTSGSELVIDFASLSGSPYGGNQLILQEGESAQVYMLSTGVGIVLAINKAVSYVTEYPSDGL